MDRRSLLASSLVAAVAVTAAPLASAATSNHTSYFAELDAIDREVARLNAGSFNQAAWDRWEAWSNRVWREIEMLPPTAENAKIKARAVWSICEGHMEHLNQGQSVACRLVRQMVAGLAA